MYPDCGLPDLAGSSRRAQAERPERPSRRIGGFPSIGALRPAEALASALRPMVGAISRWRRRRKAIRALQGLSDRHLRDIGLDRDGIVSRVEESIEAGVRHGR